LFDKIVVSIKVGAGGGNTTPACQELGVHTPFQRFGGEGSTGTVKIQWETHGQKCAAEKRNEKSREEAASRNHDHCAGQQSQQA
jgi:hypothetical protein